MNSNRAVRREMLIQQAAQLLRDEGLLTLPIDLMALAKRRDIVVEPMPKREAGVSGMLVRHGDTFGILYDASISSPGYQRFSIAHELGHFFIDGHVDCIQFDNGSHRSNAGFVSNAPYEREADNFAADLLMPKGLLRDVMRHRSDGLDTIKAIHEIACASLTASAIRYAELAEVAVAIIVSRGGKIDYCFMSDALKSFKNICWPRKGTPIPVGTLTASMARGTGKLRDAAGEAGETDTMDWFGGSQSMRAQEEVVGLGAYGGVLTIITCVDKEFSEEDEESDDDVRERWTALFRR